MKDDWLRASDNQKMWRYNRRTNRLLRLVGIYRSRSNNSRQVVLTGASSNGTQEKNIRFGNLLRATLTAWFATCIAQVIYPASAQEYPSSFWQRVPLRGSGNCQVSGTSKRIDEYINKDGIRTIDTCVVISTLTKTSSGARAQFLHAWATSANDAIWYWSSIQEVNCLSIESRSSSAWDFRSEPFLPDNYGTAKYYRDPKVWAKIYQIKWGQWEPIITRSATDKWLCRYWEYGLETN